MKSNRKNIIRTENVDTIKNIVHQKNIKHILAVIILLLTAIVILCFTKSNTIQKNELQYNVEQLENLTFKNIDLNSDIQEYAKLMRTALFGNDSVSGDTDIGESEDSTQGSIDSQESKDGSDNEDGQTEENTGNDEHTEEDNQSKNRYNVQIELNIVDQNDNEIVGNNKLKITDVTQEDEDKLEINTFDITTGESIENQEDGSFVVQNQGVIVDLKNLKKEKEYVISIDNLEVSDEYNLLISNLKLQVLIDKDENIVAKVIEATDESGENVLDQLFARLHDADAEGTLTIQPENQNPDIKIKYKKENEQDWHEYTDKVQIDENTEISAMASKDGKESEITIKVIDNIDNEVPDLINFKEKNGETEREVVVTATLKDNKSGIVKYGISKSEEIEPETIIKADEDLTDEDIEEHRNASPKLSVDVEIHDIYENGEFFIWIWDTAGNCAKKEVTITKVKVEPVAEIVETSDKNYSNLEGEQYPTLREALEASPEGANTTIKLLADIYNESNEITSKNITINLSGFTLNSKSNRNPTLIVNKGHELTIINKQEDGKTQSKGLLSSEYKHAIEVKDGAKLTLRRA